MFRSLALLTVCSVFIAGCQRQDAVKQPVAQQDAPAFTQRVNWEQVDASPETKKFLIELTAIIDRYNNEAGGVELSAHGIDGHLRDTDAKRMAASANRILDEINAMFTAPVCRPIGDTWYQVPARFTLTPVPHDEQDGPRKYRISHHDCGLYECDFIVKADGRGHVVNRRYDDLGYTW
jgi:hypothetical protein